MPQLWEWFIVTNQCDRDRATEDMCGTQDREKMQDLDITVENTVEIISVNLRIKK